MLTRLALKASDSRSGHTSVTDGTLEEQATDLRGSSCAATAHPLQIFCSPCWKCHREWPPSVQSEILRCPRPRGGLGRKETPDCIPQGSCLSNADPTLTHLTKSELSDWCTGPARRARCGVDQTLSPPLLLLLLSAPARIPTTDPHDHSSRHRGCSLRLLPTLLF